MLNRPKKQIALTLSATYRALVLAVLLSLPFASMAQYRWDFGVTAGGANYLGEMGGKEQPRKDFIWDIKLNQTRGAAGTFVRYRVHPSFGVNMGFNYARIQGADSLSDYAPRVGRNLSFRNSIKEVYVRGEYYFYTVNDVGSTGRYRVDFKAMIFAGVAGFHHNPQGYHSAHGWVDLQPLNLEGLQKPYSKYQASFPLGIGLFYTYMKKHRFGWEIGWRPTLTDYLDDVSSRYSDPAGLDPVARAFADRNSEVRVREGLPDETNYGYNQGIRNPRGDPTHNDTYMITNFTYSYSIRGKSSFSKSRYNYIVGKSRRKRTKAKF